MTLKRQVVTAEYFVAKPTRGFIQRLSRQISESRGQGKPNRTVSASKFSGGQKQRMPNSAAASRRIDKQVVQDENSLGGGRRKTGIELREPNCRSIRSQCQEDDRLLPSQSRAQKLTGQSKILCLRVELTIGIEERDKQFQILKGRPLHENVLRLHWG